MFATLITASQKWRGVQMTPKILRAIDRLRGEPAATQEQAVA